MTIHDDSREHTMDYFLESMETEQMTSAQSSALRLGEIQDMEESSNKRSDAISSLIGGVLIHLVCDVNI